MRFFLQEHLSELNLLGLFDSSSSLEGVKVYKNIADPAMVAAAERLHLDGLIIQKDGGYLTSDEYRYRSRGVVCQNLR